MKLWVDFPEDDPEPEKPKTPQSITPGFYAATITDYQVKTSTLTKRKYIQWAFRVDEIDDDFRLYYITPLRENLHWLADLIEATLKFRPEGMVEIDPENFLSRRVRLRVVNDTYLNQERSVIKKVMPL